MNNKMKLIAVAVAGTLGLPLAAQAQETSVQIYGKLYPQITNMRLGDASPVGTAVSTLSIPATGLAGSNVTGLESTNSRLGFRGTENLGGGLRAFFQLETTVGVDSGAGGTATQFWSRDTFVGMAGGFGSVKLGSMDTVYKSIGDTLSFLGISSGNFVSNSNILSKTGFGTSSASSFHLRRANSIYYESPQFGGVQALLQYSPDEAKTGNRNANLISAGVKYEAGPLYLALAHEIHNDTFGGSSNVSAALSNSANLNANSKDKATRLTGRYKIGADTTVEANIAQLQYDESGGLVGRFQNYKHNAWSIGAEQRAGAWTFAGAYAAATAGSCSLVGGAVCSTSGLDGKMLNVGASYSFSKRTYLFALASKLRNGDSARYNNISVTGARPDPGADITQVALGIAHSF
jgi:predicted porin